MQQSVCQKSLLIAGPILREGYNGAIKYQSTEYKGLLQKDLVTALKDSTKCRLQIWNDLKDKLIISSNQNLKIGSVGGNSTIVQSKGDVKIVTKRDKQPAKLRIISIDVEKISQTVRRLDIKLVNDGDSVAFTRKLNIKVKRFAYYLPMVRPSGEYDIEITNDERNALILSHKIAPDDAERIIVNVSFSKDYWYYALDMTVEIFYDKNKKVASDPIEVRVF